MEQKNNLSIWSQVEKTDPAATKNFKGLGGFQGTAIKPTYLMRKATELFGPVGIGWGWTVLVDRIDEGGPLVMPTKEAPHLPTVMAKLHTIQIELWYMHGDQRGTVTQFGHTPFVSKSSTGINTDWEVAKKSLTDAIGKCLQPLGFAADIHLGMYDDATYVDQVRGEVAIEKAEDKEAERAKQAEARLAWLKECVDLMAGAQTIYELDALNVRFSRSTEIRGEEKFQIRLSRAYSQRKTELEAHKAQANAADAAPQSEERPARRGRATGKPAPAPEQQNLAGVEA